VAGKCISGWPLEKGQMMHVSVFIQPCENVCVVELQFAYKFLQKIKRSSCIIKFLFYILTNQPG